MGVGLDLQGVGVGFGSWAHRRLHILTRRPACWRCAVGAFNMTTGPAHWELLQKARAVDNQLFVATCSPARDPGADHSRQAVSPGWHGPERE